MEDQFQKVKSDQPADRGRSRCPPIVVGWHDPNLLTQPTPVRRMAPAHWLRRDDAEHQRRSSPVHSAGGHDASRRIDPLYGSSRHPDAGDAARQQPLTQLKESLYRAPITTGRFRWKNSKWLAREGAPRTKRAYKSRRKMSEAEKSMSDSMHGLQAQIGR